MQTYKIGDVRVTRLQELAVTTGRPSALPQFTRDQAKREGEWILPFVDEAGRLLLSIHAWLVESEGRKILVDTCVGNHKPRSRFKEFDNLDLPFLAEIAKAGAAPETIDVVLCTHLHVDHVGWNTTLVDRHWVPTFPKSRYLMCAREWDHWSHFDGPSDMAVQIEDSVRPVVEAGLAELVEPTHRLTSEVWLEPTPGHTPGHASVRISSRGEEAVITGDVMHHPIQIAHPDWICAFDTDAAMGSQTRRQFVERYCDRPVRVLGTHFGGPSAGHIVRRNGSFQLSA
jgi:glyoxylase-like metal-dependent hydrolase (beta-lactamase superfamily II)